MPPSWLNQASFEPPCRYVGVNPVYCINSAEDIRLSFFRLTKCRNHKVYSTLNAVMREKGYNFINTMTRTVVQRALRGKHEVVALMLTDEILEDMKDLIVTRRMAEGIYLINRDQFEEVVGLRVNAAQACAALVNLSVATTISSEVLRAEILNRQSPLILQPNIGNVYFWHDSFQLGLDRCPEADVISPPLLILDDVRSSDNVGVILRTAFSLGICSIVVTGTSHSAIGCRAARTSMGALSYFSVMHTEDLPTTIKILREKGIRVYATSPNGMRSVQSESTRHWALVVGNEEEGITPATFEACTETLCIPQSAGDSLSVSVATGICLFELQREHLLSLERFHDYNSTRAK